LIEHLQGEFGVGLGGIRGEGYETDLVPLDYRFLLSPFPADDWNLYLYAGAGFAHYDIDEYPPSATAGVEEDGWFAFFPGGLGLQFAMDENYSFEMSGGYNLTLDDRLNAVELDENDAYWNFLIGITYAGESGSADPDGDGLTNREEKELGTNPRNPDTDGDGLTDGAEVGTHRTNPLQADTDGDGLTDGEEVNVEKTDPNKADTDGDGLRDGDEVKTHRTDPNKADSDGDTLSDGAEVNTHQTNPLNADTDGDNLKDGDEVTRHRTNPKVQDTDNGSVNDGVEVGRGTDPLNMEDDKPKVAVGESIVLEGIVFKTGSAEITAESETVLENAYDILNKHPEIVVEIQGHTDNTGSKAVNTKLSLARADAVKMWLTDKGIAADRITTAGYGPDRPIAPNTTAEGRQKNRRIEFFRVK
jgi:outer membrane protein OmpA-like peptidoglycan-associated protein